MSCSYTSLLPLGTYTDGVHWSESINVGGVVERMYMLCLHRGTISFKLHSCKCTILDTCTLPRVGKLLAYLYALEALVNPRLGISQPTVVGHRRLYR